jgi:effector-binding domain-containing protein
MIDSPQILTTAAEPAAVIHLIVPRAEIRRVMQAGREELRTALAAQDIAPAGPWFSHHFRMDPLLLDFEIGVPVKVPVSADGRVQPGQLPAARIARTFYHGPYEGLGSAWREFDSWIAANGHTPVGDLWECYLDGPESSADPADYCTELNRPLLS